MRRRFASVLAAALALVPVLALPAAAQVRIGVIVSITGPSASQGVPQRNSLAMLPKGVGNQRIEYIVLDDGTDAARAVAGARKLIDEDGVDAIVGPSTTPASLALIPIAAAKQVPVIAFGASGRIILPMDQ